MNKTVLITGASRGIGRACALHLAKNGWHIAAGYTNSTDAARRLETDVRAIGQDCRLFRADVASSAQCNQMIDDAVRQFGHIDALVCSAGIAQQKLFTDITDDDWSRMMDVNARGVFNCCRAALPHMISRKSGKIVTISSIWGVIGASCEVHYSASKAAVIGLTRALAKEAAPSGITVNCIAPGVIDTDMCRDFDDTAMSGLREATPLGRIGTPQDIAALAAFLLSDAASFITGQSIGVDGGFPG